MELHSLRRNKPHKGHLHRKTFSTSNLSCTSTNSSTAFGRKSIYLTLPQNLEAELDSNGKVVSMLKGGTTHRSGVIQIGDYVQIIEKDEAEELVSIRVVLGILHVEQRPSYPFIIEIGNVSQTSLGIALMDTPGNKIRISSILPGSLVDRCGYLRAGDILTSVHLNATETVPCSPYYTSQQIAKVLRSVVQASTSVVLTVFPDSSSQSLSMSVSVRSPARSYKTAESDDDNLSDASNLTLRNEVRQRDNNIYDECETHCDETRAPCKEPKRVLSLCLWKDFLYEDWGFSLVDEEDENEALEESIQEESHPRQSSLEWKNVEKKNGGAVVNEIRSGGSACLAGLKTGDKILKINGRDVAELKSTILVPILASLEDTLNLVILRSKN